MNPSSDMTIERDLPASQYFQREVVSSSLLKHIFLEDSVTFGAWKHLHTETTPAMLFGNVAHGITLEGKEFADFGFAPPCPVRTPTPAQWSTFEEMRATEKTAAQCEAFRSWREASEGKSVFSAEDWDRAQNVARALREHRFAGPLLAAKTETELSIFGEEDGLPVKARIDFLSAGYERGICDLKVSAFVGPRWAGHVARSGLFLQVSQYVTLARAAGLDIEGFAWVVVDPEPPHRVEVVTASAQLISRAMELRSALMARIATGDKEEIRRMDLKPWVGKERVETEDVE